MPQSEGTVDEEKTNTMGVVRMASWLTGPGQGPKVSWGVIGVVLGALLMLFGAMDTLPPTRTEFRELRLKVDDISARLSGITPANGVLSRDIADERDRRMAEKFNELAHALDAQRIAFDAQLTELKVSQEKTRDLVLRAIIEEQMRTESARPHHGK